MWKLLFVVVLFTDVIDLRAQKLLAPKYLYEQAVPSHNRQSPHTRDFVFGPCVVALNRQCPDRDVTFHLYTRTHHTIPEHVLVGPTLRSSNLSATSFNPTHPTKIIIHGYNSDMHLSVLVEVKAQYLRSKLVNVFAVDWGPLAQGPCYPAAVWNARHVGKCSAELVERIKETGARDIHVIGFSLGAHITGYMANNLKPYKLPRITGLDPALPGFVTVNHHNKLDPSDAMFVDVIHTNAFMQGKVEQSGHVDFYVNGGVLQPGCWAENRFFACHHHRAPLYFAESITTDVGFFGWPCPSYVVYLLGRCPPREPQVLMGEHVNKTVTGLYLVITSSVSPYALGKYTGPLIEIYFRKAERDRLRDFEKYQQYVGGWVDVDDLGDNYVEEYWRRKRTQRKKKKGKMVGKQPSNAALGFSVNYNNFYNAHWL